MPPAVLLCMEEALIKLGKEEEKVPDTKKQVADVLKVKYQGTEMGLFSLALEDGKNTAQLVFLLMNLMDTISQEK